MLLIQYNQLTSIKAPQRTTKNKTDIYLDQAILGEPTHKCSGWGTPHTQMPYQHQHYWFLDNLYRS